MQDRYSGWGQQNRGPARHRGGFHRGHIVKKSSKSDRQRYNIETVAGTKYTNVEDFQPIGFTSNPVKGDNVEVIVLELGGEASRMGIIMKIGDSEKHLQVEEGAMAIFSPDDPKQYIKVNKDGEVEIKASKKAVLHIPEIFLGGEEGAKPVAIEGTLDTAGHALVSAFSTRVKAV